MKDTGNSVTKMYNELMIKLQQTKDNKWDILYLDNLLSLKPGPRFYIR